MQTGSQADLLAGIRSAIQSDDYALRPHAVSHMLSEGFKESDIVGAIGNGKILEHYPDESRCGGDLSSEPDHERVSSRGD